MKTKLSALAAFVVLLALAVAAPAIQLNKIDRPNNPLGGDSLGTAVETTKVAGREIPYNISGFSCFADDSVTITVQLSYNGTDWVTYGTLDTVAAEIPDTSVAAGLQVWPAYYYRFILNDLEGGAVKYLLLYERKP